MAFPRLRLGLDDWPAADRAAWLAARREGGPLDDPGLASHWTHKTAETVLRQYGLWLAWLQETGRLDGSLRPDQRVSQETLAAYLAWLQARGLSPVTRAGRIRNLREAIRVMCPGTNLYRLDRLLQQLEAAAHPVRHKAAAVVSPVRLIELGTARMQRQPLAADTPPSRVAAERYRDGLIVAFLAYRPIRLANLAAIELGRHLEKRGTLYWCRFGSEETKNHQPLEFPVPEPLSAAIDLYLNVWRPALLRGQASRRLWISIRATAMTDNTVYCRVCHVTRETLGRPINPHLFRDCAATFIAEQAPEQIRIVARILGHETLRSSEAHYNQAGMLSAQRRYLDVIEAMRAKPAPRLQR